MSEVKKQWDELRKPFPRESIGKLPKGNIQLDYVGHAAVTDRLLQVDPEWSWEPLGTAENGLPALDAEGNLWIKLTINGVTRIGVGDGRTAKECISDAIRNAAMRFGVALDLWSKEELESNLEHPENKNERATEPPRKPAVGTAQPSPDRKLVTGAQVQLILSKTREASGLTDRQEIIEFFKTNFGMAPNEVRKDEASEILASLFDMRAGEE